KNFSADAARLLALATERKATGFVLGLPVNMDGSEGPRAQSTRAFARNLARLTELPIALWDERLSTAAVERELIAADVTRASNASRSTSPRACDSACGSAIAHRRYATASSHPGKPAVAVARPSSNACAASRSCPSARSTSRHITLPEPSQIALTGASR